MFADPDSGFVSSDGVTVIQMPKHVSYFQAPAVYTVPLQLLAYHVAILKALTSTSPATSQSPSPSKNGDIPHFLEKRGRT